MTFLNWYDTNILVNAAGQPLLIDFNLSTEPSSDEIVGGTLPYMSPEQVMSVLGASQASGFEIPSIDPRSDLYAVGVCLYQLWNGQHPLGQIPHDLSQLDLADYLLERQALGPISVNRPTDVREAAFCDLIDRCLSYYADERPATAVELLSELDAIQNLYVSKKSHPGRWARPWVAAIAVSCLIVAVLLLWSGLQAETPTLPDLPNEARKEILRRDFDSAIVLLNDALRSNPDDGALLAMRGRARLELGFYSEASDDFAAAYRHDPSINSATFAAYCTAKLNRYSSAMEWYRIVVAERSDSLSVRNNYGYVLLMASRYEESLEQLNAAIKLDDKSIEPRISRAIVRLHLAENGGEPPGATMREDLAMAMKNSIWQSATTTLALARAAAMTDQISEQNVIQAIVATLRAGTSIEIIKKDPVFTRWLSRDRFATLPQVKLREGDVDERRLLYPW